MRAKSAGIGVAATIGAAILWGSSFSVNDIGLRTLGPGSFAFWRFALAGIVCVGALAILKRADTSILRARWFWGLCAANAIAFLVQYMAQTMTTPARTALFVNTSAFMVAILERALFGMRLGWKRWLAIVVGFGGAAVLIAGGDPRGIAGGQLIGDVLAMIAGAVWSIYFVYNDRAVEKNDPVHLTAWTFLGTAVMLCFAPLLDPYLSDRPAQGLTTAGILAIVYSGLFTTALAFGLWTFGLTRIRASISAVLLMVEILVASLVSLALGRESFDAIDLVGAALLVGALVIAGTVARTDASNETPSKPSEPSKPTGEP